MLNHPSKMPILKYRRVVFYLHFGLLALAISITGFTLIIYRYFFSNSFYRHLFGLEEVFDSELDFIHLAKNILLKVIPETSSNAGIIYWFDEVRNEFKLKSLSGIPIDQINQITREIRKPQGILEKVQQKPEAFILTDLKSSLINKGLINSDLLVKNYKSLMAMPLLIQKNVLGVLILFKQKGTYRKKELKLLSTFAPRSAVRLESARLYQLAKETAQENAKLYINLSKLYQKATLDELTGLYNRHFLMQRIKEEIKKAWRFKQPLSLIFVDLDFFKKVNDEYGHQIGDQLLMELGDFIKKSIRDYDMACRFGGEEFVVLLPQTTLDNAFDLADRLREKIADHLFCATTKNLKVTASFGVSMTPEFSDPQAQFNDEQITIIAESIVSRADNALYQAKEAGRNRVVSSSEQ
jgi:diguanylate cyclase (GGDEF)-like protein